MSEIPRRGRLGRRLLRLAAASLAAGLVTAMVSLSVTAAAAAPRHRAAATLAEGWNGSKWAVQSTPGISGSTFTDLAGDACVATGNCWAVGVSQASAGSVAVIEHWNGKSWSLTSG